MSLVWAATACGSSSDTTATQSEPTGGDDAGALPDADGGDASPCGAGRSSCNGICIDTSADDANCGACGHTCTGAQHCASSSCTRSKIRHVVLVVQENHSFDSYFGRWCKAAAYSAPACTDGAKCCEAAPGTEPGSSHAAPHTLDDDSNNPASNFGSDRDHTQACELQQIDDANMDGHGKMDRFVAGASGADTCLGVGPSCANALDWAVADQATVGAYWSLAEAGALADRYFQPIAGSSSSNDMYFAVARYEFTDNDRIPISVGSGCSDPNHTCLTGTQVSYTRTTIADLLVAAGETFVAYADGYGDAAAAAKNNACPSASGDCPYSSCFLHPIACHACIYDPSDVPFTYYPSVGDAHMKDYDDLAKDLASGSLPTLSFVKARSYRNEHPNVSKIADGVAFVTGTVDAIEHSPSADSTLVLVTWDEGGGFFDHVPPPAPQPTDADQDGEGKPVPYGTRVALLAIGPFARKGTVSHVVMEHSSIVKFLEYNFVGSVGQLGARDGRVNNIGSLLDAQRTGIAIPEK